MRVARMVVFDTYGGPEVLYVVESADPVPGPGEVRIRVRAAGVQPFDWRTRRGDFAAFQPLRFPARLGNEVAGVIDRVGDDVDSLAVGDDVIASVMLSGYADTVVAPADQVGPKPAGMSWPEAGVLTASGQTASTAIEELGIGPDDTLLVHAAAGGVGSYAVQIARIKGARVIGTARAANHDYLRRLAAVPVEYGPGLAERVRAAAPDGVTAILDAVGGEALEVSVELMHGDTSRVATIADWENAARLGVRRVSTQRSRERLAELTRWYEEGRLIIEVSRTFPLDDVVEAHRLAESGHGRGKLALVV